LFQAAIAVPDSEKPRYKGRRWKEFTVENETHPLYQAFAEAIGSENVRDKTKWQPVTSNYWGGIGVPGLVCKVELNGRFVEIQFRDGDPRAHATRFNEELAPAVAAAVGTPSAQESRQTVKPTLVNASEVATGMPPSSVGGPGPIGTIY